MKPINYALLFILATLCGVLTSSATPNTNSRPNILLIIADDCTYRDLGVYGGQAKTPNLDKLAAEGMKFNRCFQAAPMCSPTRHCLYTGIYPVKSGAYPNHTMAYGWVKSIAQYLQAVGYTTHLTGKVDVKPASVFPFEYTGGGGDPRPAAFKTVLDSSIETGKPFLFIAASHQPHTPWNKGDPSQYPPESLKLPPIFVDSPITRLNYSKYLAEVTYFDGEVGSFIKQLDASPLRDNTLVIVLSEQGNAFPFAKWTCYDAGLASGCIVRWPGKVKPGSVSDALVEYVDVVPTFLEAAGVERPGILDGRSFVPVLTGATNTHKSYVFGLQTTRGILKGSDHYGIRSARDAHFLYIRNLTPEAKFRDVATENAIFASWKAQADQGGEKAKRLVHDYQSRPAEELYNCDSDPWNRNNLAKDPKYAKELATFSAQLDAWMKQQGDQGQATEMKAFERQPRKAGKAKGAAED